MAGARRLARGPWPMLVSDAETRLGARYTIDTVRALKARFPGVRFVWIMGADSLAAFHLWRRGWTQIRSGPAAVVSRPWIARAAASRHCPAVRPRPHADARRPLAAGLASPQMGVPDRTPQLPVVDEAARAGADRGFLTTS